MPKTLGGNLERGRAVSFLGIHNSDLVFSVVYSNNSNNRFQSNFLCQTTYRNAYSCHFFQQNRKLRDTMKSESKVLVIRDGKGNNLNLSSKILSYQGILSCFIRYF